MKRQTCSTIGRFQVERNYDESIDDSFVCYFACIVSSNNSSSGHVRAGGFSETPRGDWSTQQLNLWSTSQPVHITLGQFDRPGFRNDRARPRPAAPWPNRLTEIHLATGVRSVMTQTAKPRPRATLRRWRHRLRGAYLPLFIPSRSCGARLRGCMRATGIEAGETMRDTSIYYIIYIDLSSWDLYIHVTIYIYI